MVMSPGGSPAPRSSTSPHPDEHSRVLAPPGPPVPRPHRSSSTTPPEPPHQILVIGDHVNLPQHHRPAPGRTAGTTRTPARAAR